MLPAFAELVNRFQILEKENERLREENQALRAENKLLREGSERKGGPPPWVKPNVALANKKAKEKAQKARKKRTQSYTRKREEPTNIVVHACERCPDCGRALSGGWKHARRQVIDIPQTPVCVTDHVVIARQCGVCNTRCLPKLDLSGLVVGKHRLGVRLMSLIGMLRSTCRLPVRTIRSLLKSLYGLCVSTGEIVNVLHLIAQRGQPYLQDLQQQMRTSPYLHADETGWREDGQNGYLWSFSTPEIRLFQYDRSRAGHVPREVIGASYQGHVVTDFYGGYNSVSGINQRCWVHLLRDLDKLKEAHPDNQSVIDWVQSVRDLYREAKKYQKECLGARKLSCPPDGFNIFNRRDKRREFESRLAWIAAPYLDQKKMKEKAPQAVLAERIERYAPELFCFAEHPDVPSENNAAERAIRPSVIARKISGGTRSAKGSKTYAAIASMFGTWQVNDRNPWEACLHMLTYQPSAP